VSQQALVFDGQELEENTRLHDAGITAGSTLTLVVQCTTSLASVATPPELYLPGTGVPGVPGVPGGLRWPPWLTVCRRCLGSGPCRGS
jgi:hypothetical protein